MKRGLKEKVEFEAERRRWKELLVKKKKEKRMRKEKELRNLRKEADIWKFINKRRKRKEFINNKIKPEEWMKYFKMMLDGEEIVTRVRKRRRAKEKRKGRRRGKEEREELSKEEIYKAIKKLKKGKAAGADGIPNEAWKFGGTAVIRGLIVLMRQVWEENSISEKWKKA